MSHVYRVFCFQGDTLKFQSLNDQHKQPGQHTTLETIWDHLPGVIAFLDRKCQFIKANRSCCQWFGVSSTDLLGKYLVDVVAETDLTELNSVLSQVWQGQSVTHALQVGPDSGIRSIQVTCIPICDESDQVHGFYMVGTSHDDPISLRQQLDFLAGEQQVILDNLPDLVASFTSDYRYVWVNKSYLNFFGLHKQEDIRGKHVREIMGEQGWQLVQPYMQRVVSGERVIYDVEVPSASGLRNLQAVYVPSVNKHNQFEGFYGLITDIHERKLTELAYQKSEDKFRAVFEQNTIGVAQLDSKTGKFNQVNDRYCEIIGYHAEQLQDKTIQSITHSGDLQRTLDKLNDLQADRIESFSIENRYIRPDHSIVYVNLTVSRMVSSEVDGSINLIVVAEDITELKEAQKAKARLAAIVESSDDAIMSKSLDGMITSWNKGAERLFGYTAEEAIGKPKAMLLPADRPNEVNDNLACIKRGEIVDHFETKRQRKDGSLIDVTLSVSPVYDFNAKLIGAATIARDISEHKEAQKTLGRLAAIVESSDDAIMSKSLDGMITSWNKSAERMFGYTAEEAIGKPKAMLLPVDRPNEVNDNLARIKRGEIVDHFETKRQRKDGSLIDVALSVSPIYSSNKQLVGAATIARDISQRKQIESQLAESEAWFSGILNIADDALIAVDESSVIQLFNKGAERIFGYNAEEMIGQSLNTLLPKRFAETHQSHIRGFAKTPVVARQMGERSEIYGLRKDGSEFPAEASISKLKTSKGLTFTVILRDITERKQIENQLAESEAWFSGILNIADDAVIAVDESSVIQLFNKGAERIFGYSVEQMIGQSLNTLLPKRFAETHQSHIRGFAQTPVAARQMGERSEIYGLRKDGTEFPAEASISKLKTSKGLTFTVILRDITERKEAQKAGARLAAIVESSDDAIMGKSLEGIITSWNKGAERLFGYTAEEVIGQSKSILLPVDRPNEVNENLARIKDGEVIQNYETVHCHKNGLLIDVSLSVSPLRAPDGQLIGVATIARDITERKRAAEQLKTTNDRLRMLSQQMQQAKEAEQKRIAQELHDEFGQALSSLKWDLAYLKREIQRQPCLNDLDNINARIEDMSNLLGDAIATTRRIATALRPPMLDDLGLIPALEWQAHDFQERTKISCTYCVNPVIGPTTINDDQATALFRITQELLTNILRHAKASEITINLDRDDNILVLRVKDNGVGYRAPPNPQGASLGLLGIQERAESLGGRFSIQGIPGQGTTAIVQIPLSL